MDHLSIPALALVLLFITLLYRYIVYPIFESPLSRIPNAHPTSPISPLWILYIRYNDRENATVHALHAQHGPLVRLGPSEVSVNCVDGGIKTIYSGGFDKGDWYSKVFANYGVHNMFSTALREPHSKRKRMLSNVYAKSVLLASPALRAICQTVLCERMLPLVGEVVEGDRRGDGDWGKSKTKGVMEAYELFSALTMDFVTAYQFGLGQGSNFTQNLTHCRKWLENYKARQAYTFWPQEMPAFTAFMRSVGLGTLLVPKWVDEANQDIEDWCLSMCDKAEAALQSRSGDEKHAGDYPSVYAQMRASLVKEQVKEESGLAEKQGTSLTEETQLSIASEMLDQLAAGFDTSGITLTYLAWELSKPQNSQIQASLQEELRSLSPSYAKASPDVEGTELPDAKVIDELPLLHAVIMETLRLHAAIPGIQPRVTPSDATLGPPGAEVHGIPQGVRVESAAYSLHRNPEVFPKPEEWRPLRWLDADGKVDSGGEKMRWFWAFGSGGRMCVGSNLAMARKYLSSNMF